MSGAAFDVVFLSFDEPLADQLCDRLRRVLGRPVKRLHGVAPMRRAYQLTAQLVDTEFYLQADGDFEISEAFDAADVAPLPQGVAMRVWQADNAVNGLRYGYGGLKLIRAEAMRLLGGEAVDVLAALPGRVEFVAESAGRTRFNQSPFHAWRAGFRECAMLTRGDEYQAGGDRQARVAAWTGTGSGPFATWARRGAVDGVAYTRDAGAEPNSWAGLNDPAWLLRRFEQVTL